ncbi:unnamed protein product, partial [Choristocarpus tenellus]
MESAMKRIQNPRPCPAPDLDRYRDAVNVIVKHMRKMALVRGWTKWRPRLTQGQAAMRLLERQRRRLGMSARNDPNNRLEAGGQTSSQPRHNSSHTAPQQGKLDHSWFSIGSSSSSSNPGDVRVGRRLSSGQTPPSSHPSNRKRLAASHASVLLG